MRFQLQRRGVVWCGLLATVSGMASAQTVQALDVPAERRRIAQERQYHEASFAQAEVACYRRFAVSDCLQQARKNRRVALDDLRRQELVLNDEDRKRAGAAALQRIEDKIDKQISTGKAP